MSDDVLSESDLEIVHADGTVTDKGDWVRRSYADHVAERIVLRDWQRRRLELEVGNIE